MTCNQAYRDLYKGVAELIRPGVSFEELVRAMVERGTVDIPPDRREAWIDNRIVRHQAPTDSFENKLSNDRWVLVIERRTREGGTVGIRTDITDIKNAEIALRESERKYRGIFDGAQVGLARFNLINGRTLEANDHFVRMMRYDSRDDFCQRFGGPGIYVDPERWGDLLRLGRETPVVEDFTTAFYRKDGTVERVLTHDTWDPDWRLDPVVTYFAPGEIVVQPGDWFTTTCTWNNTTDHILDYPEEMCSTFGMASPLETAFECYGGVINQ